MKKLFFLLLALFAFQAQVFATQVTVGAHAIPNFNPTSIGSDVTINGNATLDSPIVTSAGLFRSAWIGLHGFRIEINGVPYYVESVDSASSLRLTTNYTASTGAVSIRWPKFIEVRIYASISFSPFGNCAATGAPCQIQAGTPGSGAWYKRFAASVVSAGGISTLYLPELSGIRAIDSTTDAFNSTAKYTVGFYRASGGSLIQYFDCSGRRQLALPPDSPTSWTQICAVNSPPVPPPTNPTTFLSEQQINARFPSCLMNNLDFFPATGNSKSCLTLSGEFSISGGILSLAAPATGYNRIQEEGANLPQRATLNFIGSSFTAADEVGVRTNVTADADLNALASNVTNGFWAAGTNLARTLTGTANRVTITNGNGTGNPVFDIGSTVATSGNNLSFFSSTTSAQLAGVISNETGTGALVFGTGPTLTGGSHTAITGLGIRSTGSGAFDLNFLNTENLTAPRNLTFTVNDANRVVNLLGNLTLANAFTTSGNNPLTFTTTGSTNITVPVTGTLATLAGIETFTNKTLPSPRIGTGILDVNGNTFFTLVPEPSAVNNIEVRNAATGQVVQLSSIGGDSNIPFIFATKGTGDFNYNTNNTQRFVIAGASADSYFGNGIVNASPTSYTINATGGNGTNIAGANLDLSAGKGTGNADPGEVAVRYPLRGASGTTLQSLSTERFPVVVSLFTNTNSGNSIANTTTETSFFTGMTGSAGSTRTIQAGITKVGTKYICRFAGNYATTAAPTGRFRLKFGATTIADTGAFALQTTSNASWVVTAEIHVQAIGASGSILVPRLRAELGSGISGAQTVTIAYGQATTVVDFTANQTIDLTFQWGTASASNTTLMFGASIDRSR